MKFRDLLIATILAFSSLCASAHVLLTTPYVVTGPTGVMAVSAPHVTMTGMAWNWGTGGGDNRMSITYSFGTATFSGGLDTGFTVATGAPTITNVLDMTTGVWTMTMADNVAGNSWQIASGTLTGAQLTGALAAFTGPQIALRDFADYFLTLSGTGFLATPMGTQPDLWSSGDQ
jgi:hypothetical protein